MNKRLILAALLSLGVLVGCGNTGASSSEPSQQPSETPSSEVSEAPSSEAQKSPYGTFENPLTPAEVAEICKDFENNAPSAEKGYVTGVIKDEPSENTKYSSWSFYLEAGSLQFQVFSAKLKSGLSTPKKGDTVVVYGYFTKFYEKYEVAYISSLNDSPEIQSIVAGTTTPDVPPSSENTSSEPTNPSNPDDGTTAVLNIESWAAANNWTNETAYPTISINSVITAKVEGTKVGNYDLNTGKYYTSGQNWRIYQSENATLTLSAASGYSLVSVKVTYAVKSGGTLVYNSNNIASGTVVTASGSSIQFSLGNTGTATNGQVRVTGIEVVYAAA